ncbi:MAG TPA: hypothetical protein VGP42_05515 [Stellaceae bacterium]|jgi:hypothetical protein|nr:hypothetical protein [Stellaceae bacterium]
MQPMAIVQAVMSAGPVMPDSQASRLGDTGKSSGNNRETGSCDQQSAFHRDLLFWFIEPTG